MKINSIKPSSKRQRINNSQFLRIIGIAILISVFIPPAQTFKVTLGKSSSNFGHTFEWEETSTCPHSLNTSFNYHQYRTGVDLAANLYPWANKYVD